MSLRGAKGVKRADNYKSAQNDLKQSMGERTLQIVIEAENEQSSNQKDWSVREDGNENNIVKS